MKQSEIFCPSSLPNPALVSPILLFDGVCYLCSGLVQYVLRHDKQQNIRFAALQSVMGQNVLRHRNLPSQGPEALETVVFVTRSRAYTKADAVLMVLRELGGWHALLAKVLGLVPAFLRNKAYTLIAQNRYRLLGKRSSCMLPPPNVRDRFLRIG